MDQEHEDTTVQIFIVKQRKDNDNHKQQLQAASTSSILKHQLQATAWKLVTNPLISLAGKPGPP